MHRSAYALFTAIAMATTLGTACAESIVQIGQSAFHAGSGMITFSEYPMNTLNPVYSPAQYGGDATSPTVTFGGYFVGQQPGSANPSACPRGAAITGCVLGEPTGPLTISPTSPATFISADFAMPTAPVLSGSPRFNGSIAIKFSTPQAGVGLIGGYFNAIGSTGITAYASNGTVLGSVSNSQLGVEFLGLATADGASDISGIEFSLIGDEPAGFDIDNVQFGTQHQVTVPTSVTPEPTTWALLGTGLAGLPSLRRRFRTVR